jgi:hypothetical protein
MTLISDDGTLPASSERLLPGDTIQVNAKRNMDQSRRHDIVRRATNGSSRGTMEAYILNASDETATNVSYSLFSVAHFFRFRGPSLLQGRRGTINDAFRSTPIPS